LTISITEWKDGRYTGFLRAGRGVRGRPDGSALLESRGAISEQLMMASKSM